MEAGLTVICIVAGFAFLGLGYIIDNIRCGLMAVLSFTVALILIIATFTCECAYDTFYYDTYVPLNNVNLSAITDYKEKNKILNKICNVNEFIMYRHKNYNNPFIGSVISNRYANLELIKIENI